MKDFLDAFVAQAERELGDRPDLAAPAPDVSSLPQALHAFYSVSNGARFPFGSLFPLDEVKHADALGAEWFAFGGDGAQTTYLCHRSPVDGASITTWEARASGVAVPLFATVEELIASEYRALLEDGDNEADFVVERVSPGVNKIAIVAELKDFCPLVTRELLEELDKLPLVLEGISAARAIGAVRRLHSMGVGCRLAKLRAA